MESRLSPDTRVLVLSMRHVRNPDAVCLTIIDHFLERAAARQVTVLMSGVRKHMWKVMVRSGLVARFESEQHIFREEAAFGSSTLDAVRRAYEILGEDLCATCPRRGNANGNKEPLYYMI